MKTKETEAKEIMNRVVLEYGTFTISKNGYTLTIEEKIHRIMIKERKESLHYRNIVENMYTLIVEYLV